MTSIEDKDQERENLEVVSVESSNNIENGDHENKKYYIGFNKKGLKHSRTQSDHNTEEIEENSLVMKNIKMKEYFEDTFDHSKIINTASGFTPKEGVHNQVSSAQQNNETTFDGNNSSSGWTSIKRTTPSNQNNQEVELNNKIAKFNVIKEEKESPSQIPESQRSRAKTQPVYKQDSPQKRIIQFEDLLNKAGESPKETKIVMVKSKKFESMEIPEISSELRDSDVFQEVMTDSVGSSDGGDSDGAKKKTGIGFPKSSFCKKSINFETETPEMENFQHYVGEIAPSEKEKNISFSGDSTSSRTARIRWKQLSHFFSAMWFLRHHEVKKLDNVDLVDEDMEIYRRMSYGNMSTFRRVNSGIENPVPQNSLPGPPLKKKKNFREALEEYLRIDSFCMCAESGRDKDIKCMEEILEQDPKKFLRSPKDPEHIANRQNAFGQTALYLAAKNGNLNVVKYLISIGVNQETISQVAQGINEIALHAAARWGHLRVLEYMVQEHSYSEKDISYCLQISTVKNVTVFLKKKLKKNSTPRFFSCFGLRALCN